MQDKTCYGTKKVKIQKLDGCEMVGVLILGIQSLDRAARAPASCQSLQFVTVGAHWDRGKLSKSQVCVCRAPPWDTVERPGLGGVTPLM